MAYFFLSNMNNKNPLIYFLGIFRPNVEKFKFYTSNDVGKAAAIVLKSLYCSAISDKGINIKKFLLVWVYTP